MTDVQIMTLVPADQLLALAEELDLVINLATCEPWGTFSAFPAPGLRAGKSAVDLETGAVYRSDGTSWGAPIGYVVSHSLALSLVSRVAAVELLQRSGFVSYPDKATMLADLTPADGTIAVILRDPTPANNGSYQKVGASGGGVWTLGTDRISSIDARVTAAEGLTSAFAVTASTLNTSKTIYDGRIQPLGPNSLGLSYAVIDTVSGRVRWGIKYDGSLFDPLAPTPLPATVNGTDTTFSGEVYTVTRLPLPIPNNLGIVRGLFSLPTSDAPNGRLIRGWKADGTEVYGPGMVPEVYAALGDSFGTGYQSNAPALASDRIWPYLVAQRRGWRLSNFSITGSTMAVVPATPGTLPMVNRLQPIIDAAPAHLSIWAGHNDLNYHVPLGTVGVFTDNTRFADAYYNTLVTLLDALPNLKITVYTLAVRPGSDYVSSTYPNVRQNNVNATAEQYRQVVRDLVAYLKNLSGNYASRLRVLEVGLALAPQAVFFRSTLYDNPPSATESDHPTLAGNILIADYVADKIL